MEYRKQTEMRIMHITCKFLVTLAGVFSIGLFAGLLLPAAWLVVMLGALLIFIALCVLFC